MSDTNISDLFAAYDQAQAAKDAAETAVAEAQANVSAAVEAIASAGGKGPYRRAGALLTAVKRENKKSGTTTWFFKSRNESNAIDVG